MEALLRRIAMDPEVIGAPIRAAEYVRMSTDHQKYSTENQSVANHAYCAASILVIGTKIFMSFIAHSLLQCCGVFGASPAARRLCHRPRRQLEFELRVSLLT